MAAFPEDYDIHASELIKLWVAEGFLDCRNESKSVEVVAEQLHSMMRDFCERQAGKRSSFFMSRTTFLILS
ncbi:putative late blight resistance protein R1B-16 [Salvia divinorum]|uniref:Late blight resistance protein R1B-16 n=1 Tax=Salvia divinorum TaxID=28513 RepID=A0ABD1GRP5_SALDI